MFVLVAPRTIDTPRPSAITSSPSTPTQTAAVCMRPPFVGLAYATRRRAACHVGDDVTSGGRRIDGAEDRAAHDDVVRAGGDRRARREHALLIVHVAARRTNAGRDDEEV